MNGKKNVSNFILKSYPLMKKIYVSKNMVKTNLLIINSPIFFVFQSNFKLKAPRGGTPPATHSVGTSPIAVRTRKHRHSRQTSCGSARSRPLFGRERPNDAGQDGGKVFATQKGSQASFATSKILENWTQTLQNRGPGPPKSNLEPSKTQFLKDI